MASARSARAMQALDRLYDTHPRDARAIDIYIADLREECSRRRREAREARDAQPEGGAE